VIIAAVDTSGFRFDTTHVKGTTYPESTPPTSQQSPSVHPTAVSPLRLFQLSTRSSEKGFPDVSAVKRIRLMVER